MYKNQTSKNNCYDRQAYCKWIAKSDCWLDSFPETSSHGLSRRTIAVPKRRSQSCDLPALSFSNRVKTSSLPLIHKRFIYLQLSFGFRPTASIGEPEYLSLNQEPTEKPCRGECIPAASHRNCQIMFCCSKGSTDHTHTGPELVEDNEVSCSLSEVSEPSILEGEIKSPLDSQSESLDTEKTISANRPTQVENTCHSLEDFE